jgi:sulfur carrier protein ThiS
MTIRIYPSRPGEPLETHERQYYAASMDGQKCSRYSQDRSHPVAVELNGRTLPPDEWPLCQLSPDSDVRIYPVPYGTGLEIAVWVSVAYQLPLLLVVLRAESRPRWLFIG